ncbi:MAG TPA: SRPBCC family protein [Gemmatimonadales bacterium]|nr:SRPBCC family protein [Gemmatimonadales bacterium]
MATQLASRADAVGYDNFRSPASDRRQGNGVTADNGDERLARFLGWFSIGLGLAEIAAPDKLAELIGVEKKPGIFRLMGLREITSGITILTQTWPAEGVWSRVAGDVLDLALLSTGLDGENPEREKTLAATVAVLGVTALDIYAGKRLSAKSNGGADGGADAGSAPGSPRRGLSVKEATTVNRPVREVYDYWHDFQNLPRFMTHLESVQVLGPRRSHWVALGPAGMKVEWDAEVIEDRPNELIAWRSMPGGHVETSGSVRFKPAPGGRGTEIVVEMRYDPPGGIIGATIAKLLGEAPDQIVVRDLKAFKNVMEIGEVVQSDASIHRRPHPAQPSTDDSDAGRQSRYRSTGR